MLNYNPARTPMEIGSNLINDDGDGKEVNNTLYKLEVSQACNSRPDICHSV